MMYDTCDKDSFDNIDEWLKEVNKYANENTCKILVGNKSDQSADRQISYEMGQKKAQEMGLQFLETSAKSNTNVVRFSFCCVYFQHFEIFYATSYF